MKKLRALVAVTAFALTMYVHAGAIGAERHSQTSADSSGTLVFAGDPKNDLYKSLVSGGESPRRFDSAEEAIAAAAPKAAVLILADGYPVSVHRAHHRHRECQGARRPVGATAHVCVALRSCPCSSARSCWRPNES